ncbi:MAG: hypothetical protein Q9220_002188 [cf. Caloplaca sp. 1 TL-2023]
MHRRRIAAVYTKSALFKSAQLAAATEAILLRCLAPRLYDDVFESRHTELLELSYSMSLDLVDAFIFGLSNGSKFLSKQEDIVQFLEHYEDRYCPESFWPQELPKLTRTLDMIGIRLLPKRTRASEEWMESYLMRMCQAAEASLLKDEKSAESADFPSVYACLKNAAFPGSGCLGTGPKQAELASELFDQMCLVLAYALYYLAQNPHAQHRLRQEIASAVPDFLHPAHSAGSNMIDQHLPPATSLDELPYLSAIICESLRMRPNSTPLPRITPDDTSVRLAGIDGIPPGVRVNAFQWFVHRDPSKWDRVDEWLPERWLDSNGKVLKGSGESQLWGFCSGPRMCAGSNLSQYRQSDHILTVGKQV